MKSRKTVENVRDHFVLGKYGSVFLTSFAKSTSYDNKGRVHRHCCLLLLWLYKLD